MRRSIRAILTAAMLSSAIASCGPVDTPSGSVCDGSHVWPPLGYSDLSTPSGVFIEPIRADTVRVRNASDRAWRFEMAVWTATPCVGFTAESPIRSGVIEPGHLVETQIDPIDRASGVPIDRKVGVAVYAPECDEACLDGPVGFGWIDIPDLPPS